MDNSAWNSEVSTQNSSPQQGQLRAKHRITRVMTQDLPLPKCLLGSLFTFAFQYGKSPVKVCMLSVQTVTLTHQEILGSAV